MTDHSCNPSGCRICNANRILADLDAWIYARRDDERAPEWRRIRNELAAVL